MASYTEIETRSTLAFAQAAAHDAFGKFYVHSCDRTFVDHEPRWQKLGDVADGVVNRLRRQRDHQAGLHIDIDHDMAEV